MGVIDRDAINKMREDIRNIQDAVTSLSARLDELSFEADVENDPVISMLSPVDATRQRDILASGDGYAAYVFAKSIPGADIQALQKVVIESGSGKYAYRFARDIPGTDIQALQQVILERGDGWAAYSFALDVTGADMVALHSRLVELNSTGDANQYLEKFNKDIEIQDKLKAQAEQSISAPALSHKDEAFQQVILERGDGLDAYRFARDIPGADIQALQQIVLERGDGWDTYRFAKDVNGANLSVLHEKLAKMGGHYLKSFNNDPDIQFRLKAQKQTLEAVGQSEPEGSTRSKTHRPS